MRTISRPWRGRWLFLLGLVLTLSLGRAWPDSSSPARGPAEKLILEGLEALHQGKFSVGKARFEGVLDADSRDPRGHLFLAFSEWWHRLELEASSPQPDLEKHLEDAIRLARAQLERQPQDPQTLSTLGTGHIFLAQHMASQGKAFRAALQAKKGKRFLERAVAQDETVVDSRFALGAYNYYADKVNLLVKGLRILLFLPGGDSEKGLEQLRYVAQHGRYFRTEAHLLLAIIYQGREEKRYLDALKHLRAGLTLNPKSPLMMASLGEFQLRLGRYREAQTTFRECLGLLEGVTDPDQLKFVGPVRVLLAESLELSLMDEEALQQLAAASSTGEISLPKMRRRALAIATRAAARTAAPETLEKIYLSLGMVEKERVWLQEKYGRSGAPNAAGKALEPALVLLEGGDVGKARTQLEALLRRQPDNPEILFHLGRSYFMEGKWIEAESFFRRVSIPESQAQTLWLEGWRELFLGRLMQIQGREREAKEFYTRAAELRGFRSRDLAWALLGPQGRDDRLWPEGIFGSGLDQGHNAADIGSGFPIGGNSPGASHGSLTGVISR